MVDDKLLKALRKVAGGDYAITYANDEDASFYVDEWLSTGCLALDAIMGGGIPLGRLVEIYGASSSGKSLIAAQIVAEAQQLGYLTLYIDTEHALSADILNAVGVDLAELIYAEPDTVQETFSLMEAFLTAKPVEKPAIIIWDSIAATTEKAEQQADYDSNNVATHARRISMGLRKFNRLVKRNNASAVFVNQIRKKIGVMFGDDTTTFGGNAVEFYSSIRVELSKGQKLRDKSKRVVGINNRALVTKNKVAPPFMSTELPIYFGLGVDDSEAAMLYMMEYCDDVVRQSGKGSAWYTYETAAGEEVKFTKKQWNEKVYEPYYDELVELIMEDEDGTN